ncbi:hypothetical protein GBA52_006452 [Prunus armeniaca]|nr:hypothetical protein GBA52_006452 [Prunus armeniaca]
MEENDVTNKFALHLVVMSMFLFLLALVFVQLTIHIHRSTSSFPHPRPLPHLPLLFFRSLNACPGPLHPPLRYDPLARPPITSCKLKAHRHCKP